VQKITARVEIRVRVDPLLLVGPLVILVNFKFMWGVVPVQVMAADVHTSLAVATPFPLSLLLLLHIPLPILFLCWPGICVGAYGGSRGTDRKPMPYPDTPTPPEQGLFWAP
jgi:hypothetical protein